MSLTAPFSAPTVTAFESWMRDRGDAGARFTYIFLMTTSVTAGDATWRRYGNGRPCMNYIGSSKVTYGAGTYTLDPAPNSAPLLLSPSLCCLSTEGSCPNNISSSGLCGTLAYYYDHGTSHDLTPLTDICCSCVWKDLSPRYCPDGHYASDYVSLSPSGLVTNLIQCLPCMPGTWMTCTEKPQCQWEIPTKDNELTRSGDYYKVSASPAPVFGCYPCSLAGGGKPHYGLDPTKKVIIRESPSTPLKWACPGQLPPYMCNSPYAGSDSTNSFCVCPRGMFESKPGECLVCPPGYMCPDGVLTPCPDHTHQPEQGMTECARCTSDGTVSGTPTLSCYGDQLLRQCVGRFKAEPLQCFACNQCISPYSKATSASVDCYMG